MIKRIEVTLFWQICDSAASLIIEKPLGMINLLKGVRCRFQMMLAKDLICWLILRSPTCRQW